MLIRHFSRHLSSLIEMGRKPIDALHRKLRPQDYTLPDLPGPEWTYHCPPLSASLMADLEQWCGFKLEDTLPPALFLLWVEPFFHQIERLLPHASPLCWTALQMTPMAPIPAQTALSLHGRLMRYEDDLHGHALVSAHLELKPLDQPNSALAVDLEGQQAIPMPPQDEEDRDTMIMPALPPLMPENARQIADLSYTKKDELALAHLLGQTSSFAATLFHGDSSPFGIFLKTSAELCRLYGPNLDRLSRLDVDFLRPVILPSRLVLSLKGDHYWLGAGPGAPALQSGQLTMKEEADAKLPL